MRTMIAGIAAVALLSSGCARLGTGGPGDDAIRDLDVELRRYEDSAGITHFVTLDPLRIGRLAALDAGSVTLAMGAMYASRPEGPQSFHTLALVLTTVNPDDRPVLESGQRLLLDIDGTYVESRPGPRGHTYRTKSTDPGLTETVMVPLSPDQMKHLAEASLVRGRLGPWLSFVLPRSQRRALLALLEELPADVRFNQEPAPGLLTVVAD